MAGVPQGVLRCFLFGCWLAAARSADAQQVIRGIVTDDSVRRTVSGAEVRIDDETQAGAVTDRTGRYLLVLPSGAAAITVRAIGYRPLTVALGASTADTLTLDFRLTALAVRLPDVTTTADAQPTPSARLMEFERRRRMGFGAFLTRAQIAQNETMTASQLLRVLRGVRLVPRPSSCGGGYSAATLRSGGFGSAGQPLHCLSDPRATFPQACYLAVFLDGHALWAYSSSEPPNLDEYPLHLLEAIEVYRGAAEIPPELNTTGAACGAVVMWTRVGG